MGRKDKEEEGKEAPLYGDILEAILSRMTLIDLVPVSRVSKAWRRAVSSSLRNSPSVKPWLVVHTQSPRNPSLSTTHAYDPRSHVWIQIVNTQSRYTSILRSSHSNLLYTLSPSKFSFSSDALNLTWHNVDSPLVWRIDPVVAIVGSRLVIAGGTCDFVDDSLAVEMYDIGSGKWETCQSMPAILKNSSATTWLSIAVSDRRIYVLEKHSGVICSFDPETKAWEGTHDLRPYTSMFYSVIGFSGDRLVLVGLVGEAENIESLEVWEVNCDTFECTEIGKMPPAMVERLKSENSPLSTIGVSTAGDFVYIYNPSYPEEIFFCEFMNGICEWGKAQNPIVRDRNRMDRFVFTCSEVGMVDLQKAFTAGSRNFTVKSAGN